MKYKCAYVTHISVHICVGMNLPMHVHWKPEVNVRHIFFCLPISVFERESLTGTGTQISAVLSSQGAHGIHLPLPPTLGNAGMHCHIQVLHGC